MRKPESESTTNSSRGANRLEAASYRIREALRERKEIRFEAGRGREDRIWCLVDPWPPGAQTYVCGIPANSIARATPSHDDGVSRLVVRRASVSSRCSGCRRC